LKVKEAMFLSVLSMAVLTSMMTTSMSFATVDLGALDEEDDEDNNSGYDTFTDDGTNGAYSGFPSEEQKIDRFEGGIPTDDELSYKYGIDEFDEPTAGPPQDELNTAGTPEQGDSKGSEREGSLPDEGEAGVAGGNDNKIDETKSDSTAYEKFLGCLSDAESGDGSTTEQEVKDCNELSYDGEESNQLNPIENIGEGNDQGDISGDNLADDKKITNGDPQTDTAN
jgi:hypothetical protein